MCFFQLSWKQKLTFQADRPVLTELRACDIVKGLCQVFIGNLPICTILPKPPLRGTVQMSRDESAFQFAVVIGELVKYHLDCIEERLEGHRVHRLVAPARKGPDIVCSRLPGRCDPRSTVCHSLGRRRNFLLRRAVLQGWRPRRRPRRSETLPDNLLAPHCPAGPGAYQLQWRLRLAIPTAPAGVSAAAKSLHLPRCRLAFQFGTASAMTPILLPLPLLRRQRRDLLDPHDRRRVPFSGQRF